MVTVHFMDAVLVKLGQRQQHPQGQSLGLLTVTQLHCLDSTDPEMRDRGTEQKKMHECEQCRPADGVLKHYFTVPATVIVFSQKAHSVPNIKLISDFVCKSDNKLRSVFASSNKCNKTNMTSLILHREEACN